MYRKTFSRLMGLSQLIFWILLIPWTVITIPLYIYYEYNSAPDWLQGIYALPWVRWEIGAVIFMTLVILLIGGGIIWNGWQRMHPLVPNSIDIDPRERFNRLKEFSKDDFLSKLRQEALLHSKKKKHRI